MTTRPDIRLADPATDLDAILTGARDFVAYANRPDILPAVDSPELETAVRQLLAVPGFHVLLAEVDGVVMGGIGYLLLPNIWDRSKASWEEVFWWVYPEAPKQTAYALLRRAKADGVEKGAVLFTAHRLINSPDGVDVAYKRLGMQPMQVTYMGAS